MLLSASLAIDGNIDCETNITLQQYRTLNRGELFLSLHCATCTSASPVPERLNRSPTQQPASTDASLINNSFDVFAAINDVLPIDESNVQEQMRDDTFLDDFFRVDLRLTTPDILCSPGRHNSDYSKTHTKHSRWYISPSHNSSLSIYSSRKRAVWSRPTSWMLPENLYEDFCVKEFNL